MVDVGNNSSSRDTDPTSEVARDLPGKVRRTLGRVPFVETAVAAWFCARDPVTPKSVKAAIIGALAYFIMPLDVIPDFIALLGYSDDAAVFWAVWRSVSKHVKPDHRDRARNYLRGL